MQSHFLLLQHGPSNCALQVKLYKCFTTGLECRLLSMALPTLLQQAEHTWFVQIFTRSLPSHVTCIWSEAYQPRVSG